MPVAPRAVSTMRRSVYNEAKQEDPENPGLIESDAWPARPQDMYGLEKLYAGRGRR